VKIALIPLLLAWFVGRALRDPRTVFALALCLLSWLVLRLVLPYSITGSTASLAMLMGGLACISSLMGALYGLDRCVLYGPFLWWLSSIHRSLLFALWICCSALLPSYLLCLIPAWFVRHDTNQVAFLLALPWLAALPVTAVALTISLFKLSRVGRSLSLVGVVCILSAAFPASSFVPGPSSLGRFLESTSIEPFGTRLLPFLVPIMASAVLLVLLPRSRAERA
jgi:hypothetical protein